MNDRDRFEESYSKIYGTPKRVLESLRHSDTYRITDGDRVDVAWCMWKAGREQMVVKLPKPLIIEGGSYCTAHAHRDENGDYLYRDEVIEALNKTGVKHDG